MASQWKISAVWRKKKSSESNEDGSDIGKFDAGDGLQSVDDELADEMNEFGYSRLD